MVLRYRTVYHELLMSVDPNQPTVYRASAFLADMWRFVRPYRVRFWVGSFIRVVSDLVWLYPVYGTAQVVDLLKVHEPGMSLQPIITIVLLMLVAVVVRYATIYAAKRILFGVSEKTALDALREGVYHAYLLPIAWHEGQNTGNKMKRADRGAYSLDRVIRIWTNNLLEIAVNFISITLIFAKFDLFVAIVTVAFLGSFYCLSRFFIVRAARVSEEVNIKEESLHGLLYEALNNIRTVQVFALARSLDRAVQGSMELLYRNIERRIVWFQSGNATRGAYGQVFRVAMMAYIIYGITQGAYEVGFLVLFVLYFGNLLRSVQELSDVTQELVIAKYAFGRLMTDLDTPVREALSAGTAQTPAGWKEIVVERLSFSYQDRPVLRDVSFTIRRGERVGLVGLSGAGKSTLLKLFLREHELQEGMITIGDVPLAEIALDDWLGHTTIVLQDTEVFNMSLRENITITNAARKGDHALLVRSLAIAHLNDVVARLPHGLETPIGEKGVRLSGGERQRLGIARAVFKEPQFLLLDEATSHLDVESEEKIKQSLRDFFQGITALVIAHRLTTIREMDRIIVLENGCVVEEGTFEALYERRGRFFELWEKQHL